ncbi:hypothetical protein PPTG_24991 [Phytophthora nicotianae INRA-310]|uniref:Uncharacterized protein n=1 Tax=Phytophthora nicotianae (strain INRA-310) TaxID=761204 RepID=W2P9N6_PHYN3|nr:hypothetical protein PPTG_24991 [Phytophthora nicotianae INRA-310]ETM97360.1 hypothetical protein PPTG_24991 [Phytophthora nicotianae INRA-310]
MDELLVNALIDMALASWERPRKDSAVRECKSDLRSYTCWRYMEKKAITACAKARSD